MKKILLFIFVFLLCSSTVYAAPTTLSFDPIEIKTSTDQTFQVNINIFSENEPVASTDVVITYNPKLLEAVPQDVKNGDIFETTGSKIIAPGKLYVYGVQKKKTDAQPARGTVATVYFKALEEGQAQLSFECSNDNSNTSQIIKFNSNFENIINCTGTLTHHSLITISNSSVLGTFTDSYSSLGRYTFLLGSLVVIFTCYLIVRYSRLHKDIA